MLDAGAETWGHFGPVSGGNTAMPCLRTAGLRGSSANFADSCWSAQNGYVLLFPVTRRACCRGRARRPFPRHRSCVGRNYVTRIEMATAGVSAVFFLNRYSGLRWTKPRANRTEPHHDLPPKGTRCGHRQGRRDSRGRCHRPLWHAVAGHDRRDCREPEAGPPWASAGLRPVAPSSRCGRRRSVT